MLYSDRLCPALTDWLTDDDACISGTEQFEAFVHPPPKSFYFPRLLQLINAYITVPKEMYRCNVQLRDNL